MYNHGSSRHQHSQEGPTRGPQGRRWWRPQYCCHCQKCLVVGRAGVASCGGWDAGAAIGDEVRLRVSAHCKGIHTHTPRSKLTRAQSIGSYTLHVYTYIQCGPCLPPVARRARFGVALGPAAGAAAAAADGVSSGRGTCMFMYMCGV